MLRVFYSLVLLVFSLLVFLTGITLVGLIVLAYFIDPIEQIMRDLSKAATR